MNGDVIIRRQQIMLKASNEKLAFECKQYLNEVIINKLPEIYGRIFHQDIPEDSYVNISAIKVDLGELQASEFKSRFVQIVEEKIVNELKKQFEENPNRKDFSVGDNFNPASTALSPSIAYNTEENQKKVALLYFLENGSFPWWYEKQIRKSPSEMLNAFDEPAQRDFLIKLLTKIKGLHSSQVQRIFSRFTYYTKSTDLERYISHLINLYPDNSIKVNVSTLLEEKNQLAQLFNIPKKTFLRQLFGFIMLHADEKDLVKNFLVDLKKAFPATVEALRNRSKEMSFSPTLFDLEQHLCHADLISNEKKITEEPEKDDQKKPADSPPPAEGLYIENAGIILLHPFLPAYFKDLKIINGKNQFVSDDARLRATILLYYLQCGSESYNEWEMPLNKILCGMNHTELVPKGIKLKKKEKEESKLLLQTVVNYWDALKGSSIEALQNTFFLRQGKITLKDNSWLIQIERTGVDVLLDRLPWSIGTIKLPWIKEIIHTEW